MGFLDKLIKKKDKKGGEQAAADPSTSTGPETNKVIATAPADPVQAEVKEQQVEAREQQVTKEVTGSDSAAAAAAEPAFDPKKVTVVFVLGGPGAGKGTQCERLVRDYGFVHLSAGDLLRAEQQREGSQYGAMIADHIKEGKIVPMEVTVALLQNAIGEALSKQGTTAAGHSVPDEHKDKWVDGKGRFLVDGFPRKMDQALKFDETVCPSRFVLFLHCTEEVMLERLLERGKTSGRTDDNVESIKKRFQTFVDTSMPVVDFYRKQDRVVEVDSIASVDDVYAQIKKAMDETFSKLGQQ